MNDDRKRKLAELEAMIIEQDRQAEEHEAKMRDELEDPRVQLGIEALVLADLDEYLAPAADTISAAITALAERLTTVGLISEENPGVPDYIGHPLITGEVVPVVHTRERTYWEQGTELIEQREGAGRMEYRRLGDDGNPLEDWQGAPPPPSRSELN